MKKIIITCCFFFMIALSVHADVFSYVDEIQERPKMKQQRMLYCGSNENPIRVVSFMNYPPFGWKETQYIKDVFEDKTIHHYYGVGIEFLKRFAYENKLRFVFVNMLNYDEAREALARGAYDILVTDYYDDSLYKTIAYYRPGYVSNPIVIVSLKSNVNQPQTLNDLVGKKGYVRKEEHFYDLYYASIPKGVNVTQISGARRAFYGLLKKEVDFLLMSKYAFETEIRRFKIEDYVTASEKPVFTPYLFMSYNVRNQCSMYIKNALENSLSRYVQDKHFVKSVLAKQLDEWQRKFQDEPSLLFETDVPPEDEEEKSINANAPQNK